MTCQLKLDSCKLKFCSKKIKTFQKCNFEFKNDIQIKFLNKIWSFFPKPLKKIWKSWRRKFSYYFSKKKWNLEKKCFVGWEFYPFKIQQSNLPLVVFKSWNLKWTIKKVHLWSFCSKKSGLCEVTQRLTSWIFWQDHNRVPQNSWQE